MQGRGRAAAATLTLAGALAASPAVAAPYCELHPTAPACLDEPPDVDPAPAPALPSPILESTGLGSFRDLRMTAGSAPSTVQVAVHERVTVSARGGTGETARLRGTFRRTCIRGGVASTESFSYDGYPTQTVTAAFGCGTTARLSEAKFVVHAEARTSGGEVRSTEDASFVFSAATQEHNWSVSENAGQRQTDITVLPGDFLTIVGGGEIWAGAWLTGTNGPDGWAGGLTSSPPYPAAARAYSLIAHLDGEWAIPVPGISSGRGWFYVGDVRYVTYLGPPTHLRLGINDDVPGNGSGYFTARVLVKRGI